MKYTIILLSLLTFTVGVFVNPVVVTSAENLGEEISQEFIDQLISVQSPLLASSSSYVINSELVIPADKEFVIGEGSKLSFEGGIISVYGTLKLSGSSVGPINIQSGPLESLGGSNTNRSPFFRIMNGGKIKMEFVHSSNTKRSLLEVVGGKTEVVHSRFENGSASDSYISAYNGSLVSFADNYFFNVQAPHVLSAFNNTKGDLQQISFEKVGLNPEQSGNSSAIAVFDGWNVVEKSNVSMGDIVIKNPLGKGIEVYGGARVSARDLNIYESGKSALASYTSGNIEIKNSNFEKNNTAIESYNANVSVSQSSIENNKDSGAIAYGGNVDLKNNWWGNKSGPKNDTYNPNGEGQVVIGSPELSPWLVEKPQEKKCCSSILFIPGIQGSRLYSKKLMENQLWEPNSNADVKKLFLNESGESIERGVYTKDIIEKTNLTAGLFDMSVYDSFVTSMKNLVVQGTISSWQVAPYDWRYSPDKIASMEIVLPKNATTSLISLFDNLIKDSKTGKVSIVTHSNGGLIAKSFIKKMIESGRGNEIDQLIMVAAPEYGTPQTIADMLHGDNQAILNGLILNKTTARDLAKNMPAAYALLPSQKYFDYAYSPAVTFNVDSDPSVSPSSKYGFTMTNRNQLEQFLTAASKDRTKPNSTNQISILNSNLLAQSARFHEYIDDFLSTSTPASNLIKVSSIVGTGNQTITGIIYKHLKKGNRVEIERTPVTSDDGDGVVLAGDASIRSGDVYQIDLRSLNLAEQHNYKHMNIMNIASTQKMIEALIQNNLKTLPPFVSRGKISTGTWKRYEFSVHSPVAILAYDNKGNKTGLIKAPTEEETGISVEEIPGSQYVNFGEAKTIITSQPPDRVELVGLDEGTFRFVATEFEGDNKISSIEYSNVPVLSGMSAQFFPASSSVMTIDYNGDGQVDKNILPSNQSEAVDFLLAIKESKQAINMSVKNSLMREMYTRELEKVEKSYSKKGIEFALRDLQSVVKRLSGAMKMYNAAQKKLKVKKLVEPIVKDITVLFYEFQRLVGLAESI